ncbi:MAG: hypothetical protein PHD72_03705 [Patescibacteria group bacterium]|nr:hypothetical protein [Patescibacteria group bacterium]
MPTFIKRLTFFLSGVFAPLLVQAQGLKDAGGKLSNVQAKSGLSADFAGTASSAMAGGLYVLGTIFLALMIYGGIVWIKAAGREEEVKRAKRIIVTAVVGLAVIMSSYALTTFILNRVNV